MNISNRGDCLRFYSDILEFQDGFKCKVLDPFFKIRVDIEDDESRASYCEKSELFDIYEYHGDPFKRFRDYFKPLAKEVHKKLCNWLDSIPLENLKAELDYQLKMINYYIRLTDSYDVIYQYVEYNESDIKIIKKRNQLKICFPYVKECLNHTYEMLERKYLHVSELSVTEQAETHSTSENKTNFNGMPIEEVKKYFEGLLRKSKNGEPFLTKEQFDKFIDSAFVKVETPDSKIKMNFGRGEKQAITKIFYSFFSISQTYENTNHVKEKYVRLLSDNFENFKYETVFDNFSK